MAGLWHKTLVYFGLADEDDEYYDDELQVAQADVESTYRRAGQRAQDREQHRSGVRPADFDDIYADDDYRRLVLAVQFCYNAYVACASRARRGRAAPGARPSGHAQELQRCPDHRRQVQGRHPGDPQPAVRARPSLAKRLIDFASGLTYALDGGMQRVADKVFLLTPKNVEVSAEERQRLLEKGFFNQY